jgi:hypothetical protein
MARTMTYSDKPVQLPPHVQAALESVFPNWDRMHQVNQRRIARMVAERHASGTRCWVRNVALVGPKHMPREQAGPSDPSKVIGGRDYYITPDGAIETENHIREDLPL